MRRGAEGLLSVTSVPNCEMSGVEELRLATDIRSRFFSGLVHPVDIPGSSLLNTLSSGRETMGVTPDILPSSLSTITKEPKRPLSDFSSSLPEVTSAASFFRSIMSSVQCFLCWISVLSALAPPSMSTSSLSITAVDGSTVTKSSEIDLLIEPTSVEFLLVPSCDDFILSSEENFFLRRRTGGFGLQSGPLKFSERLLIGLSGGVTLTSWGLNFSGVRGGLGFLGSGGETVGGFWGIVGRGTGGFLGRGGEMAGGLLGRGGEMAGGLLGRGGKTAGGFLGRGGVVAGEILLGLGTGEAGSSTFRDEMVFTV